MIRSVGLSVGWSVRPSVLLLLKSYLNHTITPAHPYATDAVVNTSLLVYELVHRSIF